MSKSHANSATVGLGFLLCALGVSMAQPNTPSPAMAAAPSPNTDSASMATANGAFNDPQILAWEMVVDSNEIAAASVAKKQKLGHDVMSYAKMLEKQHAADAKQTAKLAKKLKLTPESNQTTNDMRAKGAEELTALSAKTGADFEKAYIDAMVKGHGDALDMLDKDVLPNAKDPSLKKHLTELREHISMHLEHGKRLQGAQASR